MRQLSRNYKSRKNNCCSKELESIIKALLVKVSKLEADMDWVKKLIYSILAILLSLLVKLLLGG